MVPQVAAAMSLLSILLAFGFQSAPGGADAALTAFGRDTVLVYKSTNEKEGAFVVRIAQFLPDRYFEWEDGISQGTIFIPAKLVSDAHALVNYTLFQAGVDTRGKNATTLWLSRRVHRELKENPKVKFDLDGVATLVTVLGADQMIVEVNRAQKSLPVIKTRDEYHAERWFLDIEDNALLVKTAVRQYEQKLASITTDRPNTLRWIKDKKLGGRRQ
jgi:hypothetical protein